jgi:hypothetical protein
MNTTTRTASHYTVMGDHPTDGYITLDVSESMQDALEYRDLHGAGTVWVVFTDGTSQELA